MQPASPKGLKIWWLASRPRTWFASISPVLLGSAMAMKDGFFDPLLFFFTLMTALSIQIGTNLANDYFDFKKGADTSSRVGPVRVTQAGLASEKAMKLAIFIAFAAAALCSVYLIIQGGPIMMGLVALSIILGLAYTAGPFPIAYIGLSEVFILFFFGSLAVAGTYFLQTGVWGKEAWFVGMAPGLISSAIVVVNNLRDETQDRLAGKKTLIVRFGKGFGKAEYLFFILGAMAIPMLFFKDHPLALLSWLALPPAIPQIIAIFRETDPKMIGAILPKTGQILFFYTLLLSIGWML